MPQSSAPDLPNPPPRNRNYSSLRVIYALLTAFDNPPFVLGEETAPGCRQPEEMSLIALRSRIMYNGCMSSWQER